MTAAFFLLLATLWGPQIATGYVSTTQFDSVLVAHSSSPTICPGDWQADSNYIACCYTNYVWPATLTTGRGPGGTTMYACCPESWTCTGAVTLMKDWSTDNSGDLQTFDLESPPLPTAVQDVTPTQAEITASTGTYSGPGATPYTTSAGVVIYVNNDNSNTNTNGNGNVVGDGNDVSSGASELSGGAIAGIVAAVVSAAAAVVGVWYARKQYLSKRKRAQDGIQRQQESGSQQVTWVGVQELPHGINHLRQEMP